jgi:hypothetical protein
MHDFWSIKKPITTGASSLKTEGKRGGQNETLLAGRNEDMGEKMNR